MTRNGLARRCGRVLLAKRAMAKTTRSKSKATFMVADGTGGMMKVEDRRFERDDWPIKSKSRSREFDS
jgi:hypothetical protein